MPVKLIKVCRDLNIGMRPLVSFCRELGYDIPMDPNHRLSGEEHEKLVQAINASQEEKVDIEPVKPTALEIEKPKTKYVIYENPFEEKRRRERISNSHKHPELSIENRTCSFIHAEHWDFQEELQWVCDRKLDSSLKYTVQCEIETVGSEETPSRASITYGFLHYYKCTVPYVCVEEVVNDMTQITIVSFKKVDNTTNFDFDALLDDFLETHTEFQHLYQGKRQA